MAGPVGGSATPPLTGGSAGTRAFLFSDLRGYTSFVERAGDRAAAQLLATYRDLVREAIAARDGAEIQTEGDSFYVVFPSASSAIEAGVAIAAAALERSTAEHPIRVGVGVHAGETVATTEGLVGGAVNIAARVCSKAQPGEVLVTDTVRALTRTFLPYRYVGLGTQQLKGIAGGIPLYRVEAIPSTRVARMRRQLAARRGRLGRMGALALAGVVVVLAAGGYVASRGPECIDVRATARDLVARIDPARECVVATYAVGRRPGPIASSGAGVWIANLDDFTLTRIDASTGGSVTSGAFGVPVAVAAGEDGGLFVLLRDERTLLGDPAPTSGIARDRAAWYHADGRLRELRLLPGAGSEATGVYDSIAFSDGLAWVSDGRGGRIVIVNFGSGLPPAIEVESPSHSGLGPIDVGTGAMWVAGRLEPVVYRLDGIAVRPHAVSLLDEHGGVTAMDATETEVWLARTDGSLTRLDPETEGRRSFELEAPASALAAGSDGIWVADGPGAAIRRIDSSTGSVSPPIGVGGRPAGIAVRPDGSVWVTIQSR